MVLKEIGVTRFVLLCFSVAGIIHKYLKQLGGGMVYLAHNFKSFHL